MPSEIFEALKIAQVEQSELEELMTCFFGRRRPDGERRAIYERDEGQAALVVNYTKKGKIADILSASALHNDDINGLAALVDVELMQERPWQVGRHVLFAGCPVTGFFHHGTKFQILPVPENAPQPDRPLRTFQHPFLLEVRFRGSSITRLNITRQARAALHWSRILNGLSTTPLSRPTATSSVVWVLGPPEDCTSRLA